MILARKQLQFIARGEILSSNFAALKLICYRRSCADVRAFACTLTSRPVLVLVMHSTPEDREDVEREVAIMYHLAGHENVVKLFSAYEDKQNVQLVRVGEETRESGAFTCMDVGSNTDIYWNVVLYTISIVYFFVSQYLARLGFLAVTMINDGAHQRPCAVCAPCNQQTRFKTKLHRPSRSVRSRHPCPTAPQSR